MVFALALESNLRDNRVLAPRPFGRITNLKREQTCSQEIGLVNSKIENSKTAMAALLMSYRPSQNADGIVLKKHLPKSNLAPRNER